MAIKLPENKNYMWGMLIIIAILAGVSVSLYLQTVSLNRQLTTLEAKGPPPSGTSCPSPTIEKKGKCVLTSDATLTKPLELSSGITLDCKGHTLRPLKKGVINGDRSVPEVAIILQRVSNVTIQNCNLDDPDKKFDTGIFAANNKNSEGYGNHKILNNTINVRHNGIILGSTDNTEIIDNVLSTSIPGSITITLLHDSDSNQIINNEMIRNSSVTGPVDAGPAFVGSNHPLVGTVGGFVFLTKFHGSVSFSLLTNSIIDGKLYQLTIDPSDENEDNVFEGNTMLSKGPAENTEDFIFVSTATRTTLNNNILDGPAFNGISLNSRGTINVPTAGTCSLDPSRFCIGPFDCNISGIDSKSLGSCQGSTSVRQNEVTRDTVIENNFLSGPYSNAGINFNNGPINTKIEGNTIKGPGNFGVIFEGKALESTTMTQNTITTFRGQYASSSFTTLGSQSWQSPNRIPSTPKFKAAFGLEMSLLFSIRLLVA